MLVFQQIAQILISWAWLKPLKWIFVDWNVFGGASGLSDPTIPHFSGSTRIYAFRKTKKGWELKHMSWLKSRGKNKERLGLQSQCRRQNLDRNKRKFDYIDKVEKRKAFDPYFLYSLWSRLSESHLVSVPKSFSNPSRIGSRWEKIHERLN